MLPSRSRLECWNPDSLTFTGKAVTDGGALVAQAVDTLGTDIKTMPETKAWSGGAHSAATSMFERAAKQTDAFSAYACTVGRALVEGAGIIGAARTALLDKAEQIDSTGQLYVTDQWVVLISGVNLTVEEAAELERRAQTEQIAVNKLLLSVGSADDQTAASVTTAAAPYGFVTPNPTDPLSLLVPSAPKPGDEVPNPADPLGVVQQAMIRDTDMALTVRDIKTETRFDPATGEEISTTTTKFMQDGGKHVKTVNAEPHFSDRGPLTTEVHFDRDGNEISRSTSVVFADWADHGMSGAKTTTTQLADGTVVTSIERPNGTRSGTIRTPDGRQADIPLDLYNHPVLSTASAALTGLEVKAAHGIPMLTDEAADKVRIGAKYGGPALGIATALWDVAVADSDFAECVAIAEGATSVAAGTLGGMAGAGGTPLLAAALAFAASGGGQALGNWIGNTFCPR